MGKEGSRHSEHMGHPLTTAMGRNLTVFLEMPASWQVSTTSVTSCRVAQHNHHRSVQCETCLKAALTPRAAHCPTRPHAACPYPQLKA